MPDDGWRSIFETERDILRRQLRRWLRDRSARPTGPDRIEQEAMRTRLRAHRRRIRLGPILGWTLSAIAHVLLGLALLPMIVSERVVEAGDEEPMIISFLPPSPPLPEPVVAPPVEAPPPPEPLEEETPPVEIEAEVTPEETATPETATEEDTTSPETPEVESAEERPSDAEAVQGLGPGAHRTGRSALGSRFGERAEALRIYGGGAETEEVVTRGLAWLARHQDADGSWAPHGYSRHCEAGIACHGAGLPEYRTGVTALALLAFLGAGIDHREESPYRRNVAGALAWLTAHQDEDGLYGSRNAQYYYNHGLATFAIAEAALLTKDAHLLESAGRGVRFIERGQQRGGGWDYTSARTNRNDLSVTGWQVMALHSATAAGIPVRPETWSKLEEYLGRAVRRDGTAVYADRGTAVGRGGISIAAVGLLSRLYVGWSPRSAETSRAAVRLVREGPDPDARADWDETFQSTYYWYYATLALFHVGGEPWEAWNLYLKRTVLPLQHRHGEKDGSFDPDPNWLGAAGGRVMSTAFGVLMFEVYYRYTPLYRKLGIPAPTERTSRDRSNPAVGG